MRGCRPGGTQSPQGRGLCQEAGCAQGPGWRTAPAVRSWVEQWEQTLAQGDTMNGDKGREDHGGEAQSSGRQ